MSFPSFFFRMSYPVIIDSRAITLYKKQQCRRLLIAVDSMPTLQVAIGNVLGYWPMKAQLYSLWKWFGSNLYTHLFIQANRRLNHGDIIGNDSSDWTFAVYC